MNRPREINEAQLRAAREVPFATNAPPRHPAPDGTHPRRRNRPLPKATWGTLLLLLVFNLAFGAAALEAEPSDAQWTAMFDELHSRHFDGIDSYDLSYLVGVLTHAMGESFHSPPGATVSLTQSEMASRLYDVLTWQETAYGSPTRPHIWQDPLMEDRPAMTFWDAGGVRYVLWNPAHYYPSYSESASAYYLEQVGHYLNVARCEIAGAPIGPVGPSCPTDPGGSAGARFRDIWLVLGPAATAEAAAQFSAGSHPRVQLVTEDYYFGFVDSDGQSSVTPIDIITDTVNNSYATRAVANLIAADGEAGGLFRYLEEEHGLPIPELTWQGTTTNAQFVVENDRLVRVEFPSNNPKYRKADQFWYTVAQALVDTIHGPLIEDEMCKVSVDYLNLRTHHLWLDYSEPQHFDLAIQGEECLHRDALAHMLAGVLVHQHEINPQSQEQMDQLFEQIYPRHPGAARNLHAELTSDGIQECHHGPLLVWQCTSSGEVHKKTNTSSAAGSTLTTLVQAEQACDPEEIEHWEDPACFEDWGQEERCVSFERKEPFLWEHKLESCNEERRIMCQVASSSSGGLTFGPYTSGKLTEKKYPLRYADQACALEFPPENSTSIFTGLWYSYPIYENLAYGLEVDVVGSGARECKPGNGAKRGACEAPRTREGLDPQNPARKIKIGRHRSSSAISAAIKAARTTATLYPANYDALEVHALAIGAGSCHLIQCAKHRSGEPTRYENILVDCGSSGSGTQDLDSAGAVRYLRDEGFYSSSEPPIIISTHADADHFNYIPDLLLGGWAQLSNAVSWAAKVKKIYLGGWPEEYVGTYPPNRPRKENERIGAAQTGFHNAAGQGNGRAEMRAYLNHRRGVEGHLELQINDADLPKAGDLNTLLKDRTWQDPDFYEELHRFSGCGQADLRMLVVNTPPQDTDAEGAWDQAVRRNRASAVLELNYSRPSLDPEGNERPEPFFKAVLPGDALGETEDAAIQHLAGQGGHTLRLLMASHHGSGRHGSNSEAWLDAIKPSHVVYSAGQLHRHPRLNVVKKYHYQMSNTVLDTEKHLINSGALLLNFPNHDEENHPADQIQDLDDQAYEDLFSQQWRYIKLISNRKHYNTHDNGSMTFSVIIETDQVGVPVKNNDGQYKKPKFRIWKNRLARAPSN